MRDNYNDYGGFCLFPRMDSNTDGSAAETYRMVDADFDLLEGLWTSLGMSDGTPYDGSGTIFWTTFAATGTFSLSAETGTITDDPRSLAGFTMFTCEALDTSGDFSDGTMACWKYQLAASNENIEDGFPRFDKFNNVTFYVTSGVAYTEAMSLIKATNVLQGAAALCASALALAATLMSF